MKEKSKALITEALITLFAIGIAGGIYFLSRTIQLSITTKLLLGLNLLLFLILLIGGMIIAGSKRKEEEKTERVQLLGGIIRNVPANQVWVLRNVWSSDIGDSEKEPRGYQAKSEGWRFYIPYLWHVDLGFIDLSPIPRDPKSITVNTSDNQTAIIDWRIVTFIPDGNNAIKFAVLADGNREDFEDQRATVIFNQLSSQKTQKNLTEFSAEELENWTTQTTEKFNEEMKYLGIEARALEIQKILMPEEVRAASEYATITEKRKEVAAIKGKELDTIIQATKADATRVVMLDMFRDMLTNMVDVLANAFKTHQETKERNE